MQSLIDFFVQFGFGGIIALIVLFMAVTAALLSLILQRSNKRYPLAFLLAHTITLIVSSFAFSSIYVALGSFILIDLPISGFYILYIAMRGTSHYVEAYLFFSIAGGIQYYTIGKLVAGYMAKRERKQ